MPGESVIVYREHHSYCSHPCIAKTRSGDWLVAFSQSTHRVPFLHPPNDPQFVNLQCRSTDRGRTWQQPRIVPSYDWYGVNVPGLGCLSNGELHLNQERYLWYPKELGKKLWKEGRHIFLRTLSSGWKLAETEEQWREHCYPYVREDGGVYVQISRDEGYTWEATCQIDISPCRAAFSPHGAIELDNGEVMLALGSDDHDPFYGTNYVLLSKDRGRHWLSPVEVARQEGAAFTEPSLVQAQSGKLLLFSRDDVTGYVHQSESLDAGRTWSRPRRLSLWGFPTHSLCLEDGRIFIVYGRRKAPFGVRASMSDDEGVTWGAEIVVREDLPSDNLGYPGAIEYDSGRLFIVYYGEDSSGVTCIQGTHLFV